MPNGHAVCTSGAGIADDDRDIVAAWQKKP
jgi:hypothetical protein